MRIELSETLKEECLSQNNKPKGGLNNDYRNNNAVTV